MTTGEAHSELDFRIVPLAIMSATISPSACCAFGCLFRTRALTGAAPSIS
jgi:hypothetical protein